MEVIYNGSNQTSADSWDEDMANRGRGERPGITSTENEYSPI